MDQLRRGNEAAGREQVRNGALAPFRFPAFRSIWIANFGSNIGYIMQSVGAAWLMTSLTNSHQMVALVQASTMIPMMLFGLFAGSIADNFDRRKVMIVSQAGMLTAAATLSALTSWGLITPWLLLTLTLSQGIGMALNSPAWQASVRQQVDIAVLPQAVALNAISFNIGRTVGPALGGLLVSVASPSAVFMVNALSRPPLLAVLLRWRPEQTRPPRQPTLPAIAEGLRFCARNSAIRRVLVHGLVIGFGVAGYQALVPAVVRGPLHGDEVSFGVLLGLFGFGSVVAAVFVDRARRRLGPDVVVAGAAIVLAVGEFGMAGAGSVGMAAPAALLAGAGWVSLVTSLNVVMQMLSPETMVGRLLSVYQATTFGGMALGSWGWGAVADATSLAFSLRAGSVFLLAMLIVLRFVAPMPGAAEMRAHRAR